MGRHVVIVGAGIAGLAAARTLADRGVTCEILERSNQVGGRVASDFVDGCTVDRGFQIFLSAYPEAKRFLDLRALDLKAFPPGALVWNGARAATIAHPTREPLAAFAGILRGIVPPGDALRMLPFARRALAGPADGPGPAGQTALTRLREAGISSRTIDGFFRAFFGGVFFDRSLSTDAGRLDFLLRMFAEGFACVPAKGMGEIARQMAANVPAAKFHLGARVERVEARSVTLASGERIIGDAVILANGAHDLARLVPAMPDIAWCGTFSAWFETPDPQSLPRWLVLNGSGRGTFNHGAAMSAIAPSYAPAGRGLFVANTTFLPRDADLSSDVAADMLLTLREIRGCDATAGWKLVAAQRIRHAIPRQWPEDVARAARVGPDLLSTALPAGVFLAGDHLEDSSINGAMRSGRRAAEAILAYG
ncbi:MAG: NAD(P)/FAD-dependent oxidoreductase [bacterium]